MTAHIYTARFLRRQRVKRWKPASITVAATQALAPFKMTGEVRALIDMKSSYGKGKPPAWWRYE